MLFRERLVSDGVSWSPANELWLAVAVACGYFLAARLSLGLLIQPDGVAVFWPAAGISSGLLIALGRQVRLPVAAAVVAATLAANLMGDRNVWAALCFAVCNAAEALIAAAIIQYYFGAAFNLDRLQEVLGLLAAAVVSTVISGIGATISYKLFHSPAVPMVTIWRHWFASDAVGIIAVAPLVIGISNAVRRPLPRSDLLEGIVAIVVLAAMTGMIISLPKEPWETLVPGALLFPVLLWLAARSRPVFAAAGAFIVSLTVGWATIFGIGHFGDTSLPLEDRILQAQVVILVMTLGALVLAALFAERRRHESVLRESEAHLARANKMLERERDNKLMNLGAAISAISHELRQPLTAIVTKGSAARRFLDRTPSEISRVKGMLGEIINASFRANEVLESVHDLFGHNEQEPRLTDVNAVIHDALNLLHGELQRHRITVLTDLTASLPGVLGHKGQLQEVVFNLIQNSIDAMEVVTEKGRVLRIQTERREQDAIAISIQDSGKGIDSQIIDTVFDAFVTTKAKGKGLGLAISRMIIERHNGQLTASSNGRNGALFQIVLPTSVEHELAQVSVSGVTR
jgi:signal transduction histidine kinase